jgi:hypothetical protein
MVASLACRIYLNVAFLCFLAIERSRSLEQLQQFGKPTWHPYNFGKTRKIGLQQFGKPTWQK